MNTLTEEIVKIKELITVTDIIILVVFFAVLLIVGLLITLRSNVNYNKKCFRFFNYTVSKNGLHTIENFETLNQSIMQTQSAATYGWSLAYSDNKSWLMQTISYQNSIIYIKKDMARKNIIWGICLLLTVVSVLVSIVAATTSYLIFPIIIMFIAILTNSIINIVDEVNYRKMIKEYKLFYAAVAFGIYEVYGSLPAVNSKTFITTNTKAAAAAGHQVKIVKQEVETQKTTSKEISPKQAPAQLINEKENHIKKQEIKPKVKEEIKPAIKQEKKSELAVTQQEIKPIIKEKKSRKTWEEKVIESQEKDRLKKEEKATTKALPTETKQKAIGPEPMPAPIKVEKAAIEVKSTATKQPLTQTVKTERETNIPSAVIKEDPKNIQSEVASSKSTAAATKTEVIQSSVSVQTTKTVEATKTLATASHVENIKTMSTSQNDTIVMNTSSKMQLLSQKLAALKSTETASARKAGAKSSTIALKDPKKIPSQPKGKYDPDEVRSALAGLFGAMKSQQQQFE